jgi:hypothetical protein
MVKDTLRPVWYFSGELFNLLAVVPAPPAALFIAPAIKSFT